MAKWDVAQCIAHSEHLFGKQRNLLSLWQTIAEHFYPERADFTVTRNVGEELAVGLADSYPVLVRRDLGNAFSAMLRDGEWFKVGTNAEPDHLGVMWQQWASGRLLDLINTRSANFVRSTKEGDHDWAAFGQCVLSCEPNRNRDGLLFRNWHLRDCAWNDDETGQVGCVTRKWKNATRYELHRYFGNDKLHKNVTDNLYKDGNSFKTVDVRHLVVPAEMYGDDEIKTEYVSIWVDVANQHLIEAIGINHKYYVIPRFQTISGSPYAYSPATVVGLVDARTLQAMTHTLLEAGERYARPPIIATQKVVRSDVDLSPDGITWVDDEYDEKTGAALRTLSQDRGGFPIGLEMRAGIVDILSSAFYVNKLSLPETTRNMTATEVIERMKQYRRENLPLFAPVESEYNGQLCELAFQIAFDMGLMGSPYDIPQSIRGSDVEFKFISPLSQGEEEKKAAQFGQMSQMLAEAAQHDPNAVVNVNFDESLRDAILSVGSPAKWLNSVEQVLESRQANASKDAAMMAIEAGVPLTNEQ